MDRWMKVAPVTYNTLCAEKTSTKLFFLHNS